MAARGVKLHSSQVASSTCSRPDARCHRLQVQWKVNPLWSTGIFGALLKRFVMGDGDQDGHIHVSWGVVRALTLPGAPALLFELPRTHAHTRAHTRTHKQHRHLLAGPEIAPLTRPRTMMPWLVRRCCGCQR